MQTFLPLPSAILSAATLDRQRLGKQRVEALQILRVLQGKSTGRKNHPAVRMWHGYDRALAAYGLAVCDEWLRRGYRDNCRMEFVVAARAAERVAVERASVAAEREPIIVPPWMGNEAFHRSHQSNLVRKATRALQTTIPRCAG